MSPALLALAAAVLIGLIFIVAWELAHGRATDTPSNYRDTRGGRPVYRCALCGGEHPRSRCPWGGIHARN